MKTVIETASRKSFKQDDELTKFAQESLELVSQMKDKIKVLEVQRAIMERKTDKLFDCSFKNEVETCYLQDNEEYLEEMNQLFNKIKVLDQRSQNCRQEFDEEAPELVQ